jgi:hypothetical protein
MIQNLSQPRVAEAVAVAPAHSDDQLRMLARIKRAIRRRTSGGVQKLTVQLREETFVIGGSCLSFYCKQVAQETAMSFLKNTGDLLRNEIEVSPPPH